MGDYQILRIDPVSYTHLDVYKRQVLERVAEMDLKTLLLNPESSMAQYVLDKHYQRKHGPKAYYGQ